MLITSWRTLLLKSGTFFFRFRNYLFPIFGASMIILTRPTLFLGNKNFDVLIVTIGMVLALGGLAFRLFVIGFAYIKRGGKEGKVFADNLVVDGLFAHVRNPMYLGNFCIFVGLGLIYGSPWVYFFFIPFFTFVYLSIVVAEEDYLRRHFGAQYTAYCAKVPRFIPNFTGIKQTLSTFTYDWKKSLRKEYGTSFGTLIGCHATWLIKAHWCYGFNFYTHNLPVILIPLILIGIGYVTTRYLKLTGKLKS